MSEIGNGATVAVRLPGGIVAADVGPPVMGPPGLRGPRGERGDPGGTTTIVFSFSQRTPADLPDTGLIPAGWDDVRVPEADIQVGVGQSVEYRGDGYLYLFLGPSTIPGGWIETGQMRGPPGDTGPVGDTGPPGPMGDRGLTGNQGAPGPKGDGGDTGPQGARGEQGQPGTPGATGPAGPTGSQGATGPGGPPGPLGDPGPEGPQGEQGFQGPIGLTGPPGDQGDPGAPSFIIENFYTRTANELAAIVTGLIPANWDGPGRPVTAYQMKVGEAWLDSNPADGAYGAAVIYIGQATSSAAWITASVTGPKGDQGDTGPKGDKGDKGDPGHDWIISPIFPPDIAIGEVGDKVLVLLADPEAANHGNVYEITTGRIFTYRGNIRGPAGPEGPAGPQGPPGDVSWADLLPVVQRIDGLEARVNRLESFQLQTLGSDRVLADGADVIIATVGLAEGDYLGSGHLTFELANPAATGRLITAWVGAIGGAVISGPASAQLSLHQALPYASVALGPFRVLVSGAPGNAVLYVRSTSLGGAPVGEVVVKASTSTRDIDGLADAHPNASGIIAR